MCSCAVLSLFLSSLAASFTSPSQHTSDYSLVTPSPRSRFETDFTIKSIIGSGQFGSVYSVVQNFDQMEYAVKKTKVTKMMKMEELRTLARLTQDGCDNIVRYFQGWVEADMVYIQTEVSE